MIVAVTSNFHSLKDLEREERRDNGAEVLHRPRPFFEPLCLEQGKSLRVLLEQQPLASKQIILRHYVLSNSISSHRKINSRPCPLDDLLAYLQSKQIQIRAIAYCRRRSTPDIFKYLRKTEIIVMKTTGNLISRSKRQSPAVRREYLQLHQSSKSELKSLRVLQSHRDHLQGSFSMIRAKTKKQSQGSRLAKARRAEMLAGAKRPTINCWGCFLFSECHMSLSARVLRRRDDRNFAATLIP